MPTLAELALELGIDQSVLTAKGDVVTKWNGYFSDAETKSRDAQQKLEQAQREQEVITAKIADFGVNEAAMAELRTANAAYKAAFEEAQKSGFTVNMPNVPTPKAPPVVDPTDDVRKGLRAVGQAMRVQAKYHDVFGKPASFDPVALVDEAISHRMNVEDYAEQKFGFAAETKRKTEADLAAKRSEWEAAAVNKYKEENPIRPGMERQGMASQYPQVFKPRDAASNKTFSNLSPKERLAASVAAGREMARTLYPDA